MSRTVASFAIAAFVIVTPLGAQGRGPDRVPPGHLPPSGTCRVWIDGVPPGRQPAPTSCARAERERYSYGRGARVVYGDRDAVRRRDGWRVDRRDDNRRGERGRRRYVDASGRVCTEKTEYKKNGDRKYTVECKAPSDRDGAWKGYPVGSTTLPSTLPSMLDAVIFSRGHTSDDVTRWLGGGQYQVRYTDANADGRPERATWVDTTGRVVQQWIDGNRDGRADVVRVYENGQLVRVVGEE